MENNKKQKAKLTLMNVIEESNKYNDKNNTKQITVLDNYILNVHPLISANNMKNIFKDFGLWIQDEKVQKLMGDKPVSDYLMCFVIKHQTDLFTQMDNSNHTNADLYNIFSILMNTYALEQIVPHLDKKSVQEVLLRFGDIVKVSEQLAKVENIKKKNNKNDKNS